MKGDNKMLPDSMNVGIIADNIRALQKEVRSIPYTKIPKDYATTETDTGLKWIDGRSVYMKAFSGTTPTEDSTLTVGSIESGSLVIDISFIGTNTSGTYHLYLPTDLYPRVSAVGSIAISKSATASYQGTPFTMIVKYVKPSPALSVAPSPDNDTRSIKEPVEEVTNEPIEEVTEEPVQKTKTTRKRSTSSK